MPMTFGSSPVVAYALMRASGVRPSASAFFADITSTAAAPSFSPDALAAVTVPSFENAGFRPASDSAVTPWRTNSSVANAQRLALALRNLDRHDFVVETARLLRGFRLVLRQRRERVLLLARDAVFLRDVFRRHAHVVLVVHVPQAVDDHRVDQLRVAHAEAVARARQHVRRGAHVFLAAGDHDFRVTAR